MDTVCMRFLACLTTVWLYSCSSNDDPSDNPLIVQPDDTIYQLSTEFQGPMHPLGIEPDGQGESVVMLADLIDTNNSEQWTLTPQGDSYYRIHNASTGSITSLAVVEEGENRQIQMIATDDGSDQLWQVMVLDSGFCRITSQLMGPDLSLDIINEAVPRQVTMAPTGNFSGQHWQLDAGSETPTDDTLARCVGTEELVEVPDTSSDFIPTSAYRPATFRGFQLLISPELDAAMESSTTTLAEIEAQLVAIEQALPAAAVTELREVRIWVELDQLEEGGAQYHVSQDWLQENGYNPEKVGGVEISNATNFLNWSQTYQPWMILHELAHAWQFTNAESANEVSATFRLAVASGIYESVEYADGSLQPAYALTDDKEYFAEMTEAYFGTNDFYPFTRAQLQLFDADGYAMVRQVWGVSSSTP